MLKIFLIILGCLLNITNFSTTNKLALAAESKFVQIKAQDEKDENIKQSSENNAITEISFWTFPIGDFGNKEVLQSFIDDFNLLYPHIKINVEILSYSTGDAIIEAAIEARKAPDIVMEGPERLLANWGARGLMIDLRDMFDEERIANISAVSEKVLFACKSPDNAFYEYPLVMTTHVLAINYEIFEKAGALEFIDLENRTWTVDGFVSAMAKVRDSGLIETPGIIYSGGHGGDQGTRALVTNLYGAKFTNEDYSAYTINEEKGIQAFELLVDMVNNKSLSHRPDIVAGDAIELFAQGKTAMTLAWNANSESLYYDKLNFTPFAMNFPSHDGSVELQGGIWGFGIFNKGDQARVDASKKFIDFLANHPLQIKKSILASQFFPVNSAHKNIYAGSENEERIAVFTSFLKNFGSYYQVTPAWPEQRAAWYRLLQEVFSGKDVKSSADKYANSLNAQINP